MYTSFVVDPLKDVERFRNGLVRESYEISLYEGTFMSEPFIEKHAVSTQLKSVNQSSMKPCLIVHLVAV